MLRKLLLLSLLLFLGLSVSAQTSQGSQLQRTYAKSLDYYYGKTVGGIGWPWASTTEANSTIPITRRYDGMTILVGADSSVSKEYWYHGGRGNSNLILKVGDTTDLGLANRVYAQSVADTTGKGLASRKYVNDTVSRQQRVFNIKTYGARGDGVTLRDVTFNGTTTVTSASANFTSADVGKYMLANEQLVAIVSRVSSTQVTVSTAISTSASGQRIRYGTDNTPAIQAAINAAFAQGGGRVWVPMEPLPFFVAGPLIHSDNKGNDPNSQIWFPSLQMYYQGGTDIPVNITVEAEVAPGMNEAGFFDIGTEYYNTGTIIQSILPYSAAGGTLPAVFGCGATVDGFGTITLTEMSFKNMWVRVHNDPTHGSFLTAFNNFHSTNAFYEKCRADLDVTITNSTQPDNICVGFVTCQSNGGTMEVYKECTAIGFYAGFSTGEHGNFNNCQSMGCLFGFDFQQAAHPTDLYHFTWHWCKYNIGYNIVANSTSWGLHYLNVWGSVSERVTGGKWYDTQYDVYDPGNNLHGNLVMETVQSGVGPVNSCLKYGGDSLNYIWVAAKLNGGTVSGGGGATTYGDLTDATTVDLTTVNTPLENAIADLQSQISALNSSVGGGPLSVTFDSNVKFNRYFNMMRHEVSSPIHFAIDTTDIITGGRTKISLVSDGINTPTFDTNFVFMTPSEDYDTTTGRVNEIDFFFNGTEYEVTITLGGIASLTAYTPTLYDVHYDVIYDGLADPINESPTHYWNGPAAFVPAMDSLNGAVDTTNYIPAGRDGIYYSTFVGASPNNAVLMGLDTDATVKHMHYDVPALSTMPFAVSAHTNLIVVWEGEAQQQTVSVTLPGGSDNLYGIRVRDAATTPIIEAVYSTDSGATWSVAYTYTSTYSGKLWCKLGFTADGRICQEPKVFK